MRDDFQGTVIIKVGVEKVPFTVHKSILCKVSPYFRAALDGGFKEAHENELDLPEDEPVAFKHFLLWLYTDRILSKDAKLANVNHRTLVDLYIFGQMRGIPALQNDAIDSFIDKQEQENLIQSRELHHIYDNTPSESPLRRLMVDKVAYQAKPSRETWFSKNQIQFYPTDFFVDLVCTQSGIKWGSRPSKKDFKTSHSDYHVKIPETNAEEASVDKENIGK